MNDERETSGASDDRLRAELVETIRQCLHYAGPIDGGSEISDLIHDSIDLVELITVVSERYDVRFDLLEMDGVRSVDDLVAYVEERRGGAGSSDPLDRL